MSSAGQQRVKRLRTWLRYVWCRDDHSMVVYGDTYVSDYLHLHWWRCTKCDAVAAIPWESEAPPPVSSMFVATRTSGCWKSIADSLQHGHDNHQVRTALGWAAFPRPVAGQNWNREALFPPPYDLPPAARAVR